MSIEILGTGLGRTGTFTLKLALEHLGFGRCYHMSELFQKPEGLYFFNKAEKGEMVKWNKLFEGYKSAVDYPVARYFRQLSEYYSDAKIIHTLRDPHEWYESAYKTIFMANNLPVKRILKFASLYMFSKEIRRRLPVLIYNRKLMKLEFGTNLKDKKKIIAKFESHTENVIKKIPSKRLLLFNPSDGWKPLCNFLGAKIPEANFPFSNTFEEFLQKVDIIGTGKFLPEQKLF